MKEIKYKHSKAEQNFYDYMKEKHSNLIITKRGLPDFMIMNKKNEIVGFVEVKRTNLNDELRTEQVYFRNYCKKKKIPYQIWSPNMAKDSFSNFKYKEKWTQKTTSWQI